MDNQRRADTAIAYAATWMIVGLLLALGIGQVMFNRWVNPLPRWPYVVACLVSSVLWLWNHRLVATHRVPRLRLLLTLVLAPLAVFMAAGWMWLMPPLGLSAVLLLRSWWRWLLFAVLTVATGVVTSLDNPPGTTLVMVLTSVLMSGVLVTFTRMLLVVQELAATREQVARLRVDEERHRIQRELHDLLGRTLVTVSMRTQTALRLVEKNPQAARAQLEETATLVTSGQAQLRELVSGRSIVGLDHELASARDMCRRLGVRLDVQVEPIDDPSTDDLAARVLREAMTNMLKHSRPAHAVLRIADEGGCTVLTVENDGAVGIPASTSHGTGLRDLRTRLDDHLGGTLTAGPLAGARYRMQARMPRSVAASQQLAGHGAEPLPERN